MSPCKIAQHKVAPTPLSIWANLNIQCKIEFITEVRISEHVANNGVWVSILDLVLISLPARRIWWEVWNCLSHQAFPRRTSLLDAVNHLVHLAIILERSKVIVLEHSECPELHQLINVALGHLNLVKQKVGDPELNRIVKWLSNIFRLDQLLGIGARWEINTVDIAQKS